MGPRGIPGAGVAALKAEAAILDKKFKDDEKKLQNSVSAMGAAATGLAAWAGIVTIALIVIVALVFRKLRKRNDWKNMGAESVYSDAESALSSDKSDKSSVVDVDSLSIAPSLPEHDNSAFAADLDDLPPAKPVIAHRELDTELNGRTIGALANLDDCDDDDDFDKASSITAPSIASTDTPRFGHAMYRGIGLDKKTGGGASFL